MSRTFPRPMEASADPVVSAPAWLRALAVSLPCWTLGVGACRARRATDAATPATDTHRAPGVDAAVPDASSDVAADAGRPRPTRTLSAVSALGPAGMNAVGTLALTPDGALVAGGNLHGALAVSLSADGALRWRAARTSGCDSLGATALTVTPDGQAVAAELCRHDHRPNENAALWFDARGVLQARRVLARGDFWVSALAVAGDGLDADVLRATRRERSEQRESETGAHVGTLSRSRRRAGHTHSLTLRRPRGA